VEDDSGATLKWRPSNRLLKYIPNFARRILVEAAIGFA